MPSKLEKIEHVVVLMMENRSFDHMLGYLKLKGLLPVDGLTGRESNPRPQGGEVNVAPADGTRTPTDLGHAYADVAEQIDGGNQGFVRNYEAFARTRLKLPGADLGVPMAYHDETHVWAYHHLAQAFAVCDRWFASLPGPTIPNRLFAVAGQSDGDTDQPRLPKFYRVKTIFDCLDAALGGTPKGDRWGYYYHDFAMLQLVPHHTLDPRIQKVEAFLRRAAVGSLPTVSWIDPNFADFGSSNDDHPPKSDLHDGQTLVAEVYRALLEAPQDLWKKTLFVVLYDEHGGFFDHVPPPPSGDAAPFDRFGVRVPALVVSPWIDPSVDHTVRDHTSVLKTILTRFAPGESLTDRVARATDLGGLLTRDAPRADATPVPAPRSPRAPAPTLAEASEPTEMETLIRAYQGAVRSRRATDEP